MNNGIKLTKSKIPLCKATHVGFGILAVGFGCCYHSFEVIIKNKGKSDDWRSNKYVIITKR